MNIAGALLVLTIALHGSSSVTALDADARQAALDSHNSRRSNLALGNEPAHGGGNLSSGRNIYKLYYSEELEGFAQSWADSCVYNHSHRPNVGENIYMTTAKQNPVDAINTAAKLFWQENIDIDIPSNLNLTKSAFNTGIGHFTQMAWGATTQIGCGVTYCPNKPMTFVVCNYLTAGNVINNYIYEKGDPCQKDSDCTTYPKSICDADEGLCLVVGQESGSQNSTEDQDQEESTTSTPVQSSTSPSGGSSGNSSSSENLMNEEARQAALDSHNSRRSSNEPARGGGKMPTGKNIYKLSYSKDLEKLAQNWTDGCVYSRSSLERRSQIGENVYMATTKQDPAEAINTAAWLFWQENVEGGTPTDLNMTTEAFSRGICLFTQMAWGATTKIGCGATYCPEAERPMTFVVCNYKVSGNYVNHLIYEKGDPCQKDSDCTTYPNSTCSVSEGLCLVAGQDSGTK